MNIYPFSKPVFIDIRQCLGHLFEQYFTELLLKADRGKESKLA